MTGSRARRDRSRRSLPTAVLWDMDGTLADSEPLWFVACRDLAEQHGATWRHEDAMSMVGRPTAGAAVIGVESALPVTPRPGLVVVPSLSRLTAEAIREAAVAGGG